MKKYVLLLCLLSSSLVMAHGPRGGHWGWVGGHWVWMAPAVVGGVIVYNVTQPPPPVIIQTQPVQPSLQDCSPWTEIQNQDGTITRTRTCR